MGLRGLHGPDGPIRRRGGATLAVALVRKFALIGVTTDWESVSSRCFTLIPRGE